MLNKKTGLEDVVAAETEICHVDGIHGDLIYRGYRAKELALRCSFEEAAFLLWRGHMPGDAELRAFSERLALFRVLPPALRKLLDAMPAEAPAISVMMAACAAMAEAGLDRPPSEEQALRITALLPVILAYRYRSVRGIAWNDRPEAAGHVDHLLRLLLGRAPSEAHVRAMTAYMVLTMEHGLNASTFAARVVASTESDLYSAVGAAIGAMKGPLHGGAPAGVLALLDDIGTKERAEPFLSELLERGRKLPGFGHRVYKTTDPRAEALREVAGSLACGDPWLDLAVHVERTGVRLLRQFKPGRELYANVEFYAAAVMRAAGLPPELFTPVFSAARAVGWTAHVLEQAANNRIYRPQSVYVGPMPAE
ncbi:citrate/2-methylcitrate synthase [Paenibacillus humicola]|uniref:citrate/2-methylcitrate synthase n=1 Tax=Paenibacillus humicola TaxID=3110540 RepID=UPI00237AC206|nr:citrate/2-methylcitrate synthase [Paenibacillus humicola]